MLPERVCRLEGRLHAHLGIAEPSAVYYRLKAAKGGAVKGVPGVCAVEISCVARVSRAARIPRG